MTEQNSTYLGELCHAMKLLGAHPRTLFIGQAVAYPGTSMSGTLADVPPEKLIELPVMEEAQMGMSIGLAVAGFIPITIYPRWNFLLLATNQIVNHLDKLPIISNGGYCPKVIIRVGIAADTPLNPQAQHLGDFTAAFKSMCHTVEVLRLDRPGDIVPAYEHALLREDGRSTLLVEHTARLAL